MVQGAWPHLALGLLSAPPPPAAGRRIVPLNAIKPGSQDELEVWNSPLQEAAVMGFEYGALVVGGPGAGASMGLAPSSLGSGSS